MNVIFNFNEHINDSDHYDPTIEDIIYKKINKKIKLDFTSTLDMYVKIEEFEEDFQFTEKELEYLSWGLVYYKIEMITICKDYLEITIK